MDEIKSAYGEPPCEYDTEDDEHCLNYFYDDGFSIYFTCNSSGEVICFQIVVGMG